MALDPRRAYPWYDDGIIADFQNYIHISNMTLSEVSPGRENNYTRISVANSNPGSLRREEPEDDERE